MIGTLLCKQAQNDISPQIMTIRSYIQCFKGFGFGWPPLPPPLDGQWPYFRAFLIFGHFPKFSNHFSEAFPLTLDDIERHYNLHQRNSYFSHPWHPAWNLFPAWRLALSFVTEFYISYMRLNVQCSFVRSITPSMHNIVNTESCLTSLLHSSATDCWLFTQPPKDPKKA